MKLFRKEFTHAYAGTATTQPLALKLIIVLDWMALSIGKHYD